MEARKAGYTVSDRVYDRMIGALQSFARDYRAGMYDEYQSAVYANYVLALAGKPDRSTLFYLKDNAISQLKDYSRFQLLGALAMAGDLATARQLMPKTILATDTSRNGKAAATSIRRFVRGRSCSISSPKSTPPAHWFRNWWRA